MRALPLVSAPKRRSRGQGAVKVLATGACLVLAVAACGRSSGGSSSPSASASANTGGGASGSPAAAGTFGTLKAICGPGKATGATGRGVTNTDIRIGVTADPGAAAAPGLEQEFFDTADGFSKWCNAAGGIAGRKIVIDKWDAKLFNVGQAMTNACQKDFMLVGNGNAFDSAGVKIREACKLGQIPAYVTSPQAVSATLQVQSTPIPPTQVNNGALRLLTAEYPEVKTAGVGIGGSNLSSLVPVGLKAQQYLTEVGIKTAVLQEQPPLVDNYRPYMEQMKGAGAKAYYGISAQDPSPIVQAMKNVGWTPDYILYSTQFYGPQAVAAAKATPVFPPSYVQFGALPFELTSKYPVLQQTTSIVRDAVPNAKLTTFTESAMSAWTLWAQSATACGSTLTVQCVLDKAQNHTDWTAGGLYPSHSLEPNAPASPCVAIVRLTPTGFVYDQKATNPTAGHEPFNCDPENVKNVKSYESST